MTIETALAKGSLDVTSRRDPEKVYHRMPVKQLVDMNPSVDWDKYFAAIAAPVKTVNVAVPEFFQQLETEIKEVSLDDWKVYMTWHVVHSAAPILPTAFVNENFEFYGKTLDGHERIAAAMEALRAVYRCRSRRGAGPEVCGADFRRAGQGEDARNGTRAGTGSAAAISTSLTG